LVLAFIRLLFPLASAFSSLLLFLCNIPLVVAMDRLFIYFFGTRIYSPLVFPRKRVFIALSIFVPYSISCGDGWFINFGFPHLLAPCFRLQVCFYRSRYSFLMKIDDGDLSINLFVSGSPHRSTEKLNARRKTSLENAKIAKQFQIPIAINIKNNRIGNGNTG
jgi:hypothetical protein